MDFISNLFGSNSITKKKQNVVEQLKNKNIGKPSATSMYKKHRNPMLTQDGSVHITGAEPVEYVGGRKRRRTRRKRRKSRRKRRKSRKKRRKSRRKRRR